VWLWRLLWLLAGIDVQQLWLLLLLLAWKLLWLWLWLWLWHFEMVGNGNDLHCLF
jgi:hypothetical protein